MISLQENFQHIQHQIRETALAWGRDLDGITLVGVTKHKSAAVVEAAIQAGCTHLGENYVQEAVEKIETIGKDRACWHFIGHLQTNKAKVAVQYFDLIHTVDTVKLAREIDKQAAKIGKRQKILLQVNIGQEDTKSGVGIKEAITLAREMRGFEHLSLDGLMCMPPYFEDPEKARIYFKKLVQIQKELMGAGIGQMEHLSMGMSNDFRVAIEEGSTLVRVGSAIFGERK